MNLTINIGGQSYNVKTAKQLWRTIRNIVFTHKGVTGGMYIIDHNDVESVLEHHARDNVQDADVCRRVIADLKK